jgi:hypothetical protein
MEARVLGAIGEVKVSVAEARKDQLDFVRVHADDHAAQKRESEKVHGEFQAFMRHAEISKARQDGALGVLRLFFDVAGRNWKALAAVSAGLAVISGNIHLSIGLAP